MTLPSPRYEHVHAVRQHADLAPSVVEALNLPAGQAVG
jgi:hypothetical protein